MMRKKFSFTFVFFVGILALITACSTVTRHYSDDPFYSSVGDWDSTRFPLIKPYEVISLDAGIWGMKLHVLQSPEGIYWYLGIGDLQKIAVMNDVILVYTQDKPYVDKEAGQKVLYWFVIIPDEKIETGFDNEDDFLKYIQEYGINEPVWEDPNTLFQRFQETGCLEWIPGCK
jgi:hypothetical protein